MLCHMQLFLPETISILNKGRNHGCWFWPLISLINCHQLLKINMISLALWAQICWCQFYVMKLHMSWLIGGRDLLYSCCSSWNHCYWSTILDASNSFSSCRCWPSTLPLRLLPLDVSHESDSMFSPVLMSRCWAAFSNGQISDELKVPDLILSDLRRVQNP